MLGLVPDEKVKTFSCDCQTTKTFILREYVPEYLANIKSVREHRKALQEEEQRNRGRINLDDLTEPPEGAKLWKPSPEYEGFVLLPEEFERLYKIRTQHGLNKLEHNKEELEKILGRKL